MNTFLSFFGKKLALLSCIAFVLLVAVPFFDIPLQEQEGKLIGMVETTYAVDKTSAEYKAAEQRVETAQQKYDDMRKAGAQAYTATQIAAAEADLAEARSQFNAVGGSNSYTEEELANSMMKGGSEIREKIGEVAALLVSIFTPIIAILATVIGSLMGDEFIMGGNSAGGAAIADVLYELWLVFRDIMNYIFILILLVIAFMNIISPIPGAGGDSYALKTTLPKLIIAIVVINLTWFGARVVFDAVQITTQVVFGLPQAVIETDLKSDKVRCTVKNGSGDEGKRIDGLCHPLYIDIDMINGIDDKKATEGLTENGFTDGTAANTAFAGLIKRLEVDVKKADDPAQKARIEKKIQTLKDQEGDLQGVNNYGGVTIYWADFNTDRFNEGTIAPLFAFSLLQVQNLPQVASDGIKDGSGWSSLLINSIMALVLMIIIIVLFAMMAINLFFRVIVLWANIIASPFMGLMMFKDELKISASENEYLGLAAFLKHAFAPAIMGFPLVIGFIMIIVARQEHINISGQMGMNGPLVDNLSNIHQLFFYGLTIAVMWVGGVEAVKMTSTEMVKSTFIEPIETGVKGAAKFIAKAPMYLTFIPVADDGNPDTNDKMSLKNLLDAPGVIGSGMENADRERLTQIMGNETPESKYQKEGKKIYNFMHQSNTQKQGDEIWEKIKKANKRGDIDSIFKDGKNSGFKKAFTSSGVSWETFIKGENDKRNDNLSIGKIQKLIAMEPTITGSATNTRTASSTAAATPKITKAKADIQNFQLPAGSTLQASDEATIKQLVTQALAEEKANAATENRTAKYADIRTQLATLHSNQEIKDLINAVVDPQ